MIDALIRHRIERAVKKDPARDTPAATVIAFPYLRTVDADAGCYMVPVQSVHDAAQGRWRAATVWLANDNTLPDEASITGPVANSARLAMQAVS